MLGGFPTCLGLRPFSERRDMRPRVWPSLVFQQLPITPFHITELFQVVKVFPLKLLKFNFSYGGKKKLKINQRNTGMFLQIKTLSDQTLAQVQT